MNTRSTLQLCFATAMLLPASAGAVVIERIGDSGTQGTAASEISLAATDTHHLMTAMRDGNGNLKVTRWDVDLDGTVTRRGSTTGSEVVSATAIDAGFLPGSATPYWANVVNASGQMKLILWGSAATARRASTRTPAARSGAATWPSPAATRSDSARRRSPSS